MTALIHVLGSDIPHHNQTVLRFFNDELAADPQARRFMIVGDEASVRDGYPALDVTCYPGKKALAQAAEAKQAFTILQREHEPDADRWLQEAEQLLYALTHEPPTAPAAYNIESLQLD